MMAQSKNEAEARRMALDHLHAVISKATHMREQQDRVLLEKHRGKHSEASFLAFTFLKLDTGPLKDLLQTDDDGVMEWINSLPETRQVLGFYGLQFVHTHTVRYQKQPRHLTIALKDSTPNTLFRPLPPL